MQIIPVRVQGDREAGSHREGAARKPLAGAPVRIRHPQVGPLELRRERLLVGDSGGQLLLIYHAEPGSDSARSLALLGSPAADRIG